MLAAIYRRLKEMLDSLDAIDTNTAAQPPPSSVFSGFGLSDYTSGTTSYFGYLDDDGGYIILSLNNTDGMVRYAVGSSGYVYEAGGGEFAAWALGLSYSPYDETDF